MARMVMENACELDASLQPVGMIGDNTPMGARSRPTKRAGSVRVIAGRWRGRRIEVPDTQDMRPTPDRVRETLFNWLAPTLPGARCLDLYAGTGVLGIEALSRGASQTVFVDKSPSVTRQLIATLNGLEAAGAEVVTADAVDYLNHVPSPCDIVFLDPPYGTALDNLCTLLDQGWLAPRAQIYLEWNRKQEPPEMPSDWTLSRDRTAGQVRYALAERG
jgi:16S rRNA (guanine966-N2)-methyltransferase